MNPICFPGLGLEFNISRVAFSLFGKNIYWYGVIIALGLVLAVTYCYRTSDDYGIRKDDVIDLMIFAVPLSVIGARIYYVIFYLDLYYSPETGMDWGSAIAVWDGGLAIYGAVIVAVAVLAVFCRVKKISFFAFGDVGVMGLFIGQAMGRWGNFINQEAFGGPTDLPWRMGLTVGGQYVEVHPTFFYESLWNIVGFLVIHFILRKLRKFDGQQFFTYLLWYGLGRFWIEGLRTDSLYIGHTDIRVSQVVALVSAAVGAAVLIWKLCIKKADGSELYVHRIKSESPEPPTQEKDKHKETE